MYKYSNFSHTAQLPAIVLLLSRFNTPHGGHHYAQRYQHHQHRHRYRHYYSLSMLVICICIHQNDEAVYRDSEGYCCFDRGGGGD